MTYKIVKNALLFPLLSAYTLLCAQSARPQGDSLQLRFSLPTTARYAAADLLSNTYIITALNAVEKYNSDGRLLARYTDNRRGQAAWIDVSNPLKILVWYADFRTVLFLDRSLTELGEVNLIQAGYPDVRIVAAAQDGNLWLYDEVNFRLLKITPDGEKRAESQSLNLLEYTPRQAAMLRENDNRVWMADPAAGIGVFNIFGQFEQARKLGQDVFDFQVIDNQFSYLSDSSIVSERWPLPEQTEVALPAPLRPCLKWLGRQRLFVQKEGKLEVYEMKTVRD